MEVGHDDGDLQSISGYEPHTARGLFKQALLAESRSQRLTALPS
jgi:hypothetical protein